MRNKAYRDGAVAAHISNTIAAQIAMMREARGWTQTVLAEKAGMKQSRISALEDPNFENVEIATLRRLASAFDVALTVRFIPFSGLASWTTTLSESDLVVPDFSQDALPHPATAGSIRAVGPLTINSEIKVPPQVSGKTDVYTIYDNGKLVSISGMTGASSLPGPNDGQKSGPSFVSAAAEP
jgi:transcriptional regulator with XRE-family HTH domain